MEKVNGHIEDRCPENVEETVEHYLAGDLPEEQMDAFEDHYFACEACTAKLSEQQAVMDQVVEFANELFPEAVPRTSPDAPKMPLSMPPASGVRQGSGYRWLLNAVAAVLLVGLTWYLYDPFGPRPNDFSANFVPNDVLEQQIAMVLRISASFRAISPKPGANLTTTPVFDWQEIATMSTLSITILDNKARRIFQEKEATPPFELPRDLAPGLYYWTLDSASETIYANRFYVRP